MKTIRLVFIVFCVSGCSIQKSDNDILTVFDLVEKIEHERKDYYTVDVGDLRRVNKPTAITYVGTIDSYHLFQEWSKYKVKEGQIFSFAVSKKSCVVHDEATPKNELYYFENVFMQRRRVSLENGKCLVPPRKIPPSEKTF